MPKMKTNAAAKKRFTFTGTGKIKRKRLSQSHPDQKDDETKAQPLLFGHGFAGRRGQDQEPAGEIIRPEFALFINTERISPEERERITSLTALSKTFKYATFSQRCCVTRKKKKGFEACQG